MVDLKPKIIERIDGVEKAVTDVIATTAAALANDGKIDKAEGASIRKKLATFWGELQTGVIIMLALITQDAASTIIGALSYGLIWILLAGPLAKSGILDKYKTFEEGAEKRITALMWVINGKDEAIHALEKTKDEEINDLKYENFKLNFLLKEAVDKINGVLPKHD